VVAIDSRGKFATYSQGIYTPDHPVVSGDPDHLVTLVGWGACNGQEYGIIKNSWGPDWGENGYVRYDLKSILAGIQDGGNDKCAMID